jgi:exodeoxyribonuclease III
MDVTVATWNINSVRLRLDQVLRLLAEEAPDVLCLQETKCANGSFPLSALKAAGYPHIAVHGQKSYNGLAVISRFPILAEDSRSFCDRADCRHLAVTIDTGGRPLTIHNLYVPAGGDEPDPDINWKYAHKLAFLDEMARWMRDSSRPRTLIVGDLNVAPLETDVWSHKQLLKVVSHTPPETERLGAAQAAGGWVDVMRQFVPPAEKLFTWWSYRSPAWEKSNRGRRLDHIWASEDLATDARAMRVLRDARNWERPSDHVPVIASFA